MTDDEDENESFKLGQIVETFNKIYLKPNF